MVPVEPCGSIPASAGEPDVLIGREQLQEVYPRRVRGNRWIQRHLEHRPRSIPASAGEPLDSAPPGTPTAVYPRECGGTNLMPVLDRIVEGLSPRVRGNQRAGDGGHRHDRSIPASAGEPAFSGARPLLWRVYPRECGGNLTRPTFNKGRPGSIPASAGEPVRHLWQWGPNRVYPRECGGTWPKRDATRFG